MNIPRQRDACSEFSRSRRENCSSRTNVQLWFKMNYSFPWRLDLKVELVFYLLSRSKLELFSTYSSSRAKLSRLFANTASSLRRDSRTFLGVYSLTSTVFSLSGRIRTKLRRFPGIGTNVKSHFLCSNFLQKWVDQIWNDAQDTFNCVTRDPLVHSINCNLLGWSWPCPS